MANFPASLDALSNPTGGTNQNDPGFLHSVQHGTANDILELLERKAGTSEASAQDAPLADTVLASSTTGKSKWRKVATTDLAPNAVTQSQYINGTSTNPTTTSTTYVDLPEITATLTTVGGDLLVWLSATLFMTTNQNVGLALSLDGAAEVAIQLNTPNPTTQALACVAKFSGVAAGSHTVKGRWRVASGTGTATAVGTQRQMLVLEVKA